MLLQFVVVPYMLNPYVYDLLPSKHFEVLILELLETKNQVPNGHLSSICGKIVKTVGKDAVI